MLLNGPTSVLFYGSFQAFHIVIFIWCSSQFQHLDLFAGTGYLTAALP